ncbi:MAG: ATPase, partial [Epsilonproteobacteria bacterium]|nr:ATPase [Campylobacterota bacterium]
MLRINIESVALSGYKTIKEIDNLVFSDVNIFIGANGSGKS